MRAAPASIPLYKKLQHDLDSSQQDHRLEDELAPAVLDACRSLWIEFTELSRLDPLMFSENERELLRWYAEQEFRLGAGGSRCVACRAHVRHALPIRAEAGDGSVREFLSLCTRCLVALEYESDRIWYVVGDRLIEHYVPRRRANRKAA